MKFIKILIIAFVVCFAVQIVWGMPTVKNYIKKEVRAAKMLNIVIKYNLKPEGLTA